MKRLKTLGLFVVAVILTVGTITSLPSHAAIPGDNAAIDVNTSGVTPNNSSSNMNLPLVIDTSQDGRFVVFTSLATDIVSPSITFTGSQVFVRDRLTNTTELISKSAAGVSGDWPSYRARISEDGRYVVFDSRSTNLVAGDTNDKSDIFMRDRTLNTITRISVPNSGGETNDTSFGSDISADGKYVVFGSRATNLISSPSVSGVSEIYSKNMTTGVIILLSQSSTGAAGDNYSSGPQISCEGRFIIFSSRATNLVNGSTLSVSYRTYIVDTLKTHDPQPIGGTGVSGGNGNATISCNGNYISFPSTANNLVSGDTNGKQDIFLYNRLNNTIKRVSLDSSNTQANNDSLGDVNSTRTSVSNDGKYVVFESSATNLVAGDTNTVNDVFLRNTQTNTTELVSRDSTGTLGNSFSGRPTISSDGKYINFYSDATNLVSGYSGDVYASKSGAGYDY